MPWKVRRNLSRQRTPMRNSLPCCESPLLVPLHLPSRDRTNRIRHSPLPHLKTGSLGSALRGVIRLVRNRTKRLSVNLQMRSEPQDESGEAYKDFSENHETSDGIHGGTDQIPDTQCPASKQALWARAMWHGNRLE